MSETEADDRGSGSSGGWADNAMRAGTLLWFAIPAAALATAILEPYLGDPAYLVFAVALGGFVVAWLVACVVPGGDPERSIVWVGFLVLGLLVGVVSSAVLSGLEDSSGSVAEGAERFFSMIVGAAIATWILFFVLLALEWALPESRAAVRERQQQEDEEEDRRRRRREPAPWEGGLTLSKPRVLVVLVPVVALGLAMGLLFLAWGISFAFGLGGADNDLAVGVLLIACGAFSLCGAITVAYLFWRAPEEQLRDSEWFWKDTGPSDPRHLSTRT